MKRSVLVTSLLLCALAACGNSPRESQGQSSVSSPNTSTDNTAAGDTPVGTTPPNVSCPGTPTVALAEGPYYKANPPQRTQLRTDETPGIPLQLLVAVVDTECQPISNARVDTWHADGTGNYDNSGYKLRGYTFTNDSGQATFATVIPGLYPGRTEHVHLKVTPPRGATLTTQLFVPGVPQNDRDGIYRKANEMTMTGTNANQSGTYTVVLRRTAR
ncbi:MAG: hypothetical protein ACOYN3_02300 [Acidimicrobiia bacterium]